MNYNDADFHYGLLLCVQNALHLSKNQMAPLTANIAKQYEWKD